MRLSNYFLPTLREIPAEAHIISHQLMLRTGMVHQTSAGIYAWLPLGLRVLEKIEKIICDEQEKIGCHKVMMPTLQSSDLWVESGRYEDYGKEMLRFKDRHEREMLYGPTNEEMITDIFRTYVKSYKSLPLNLYQIQWKFRDEIRPRFGVMRGREFLMKDGYSFDLSYEDARQTYKNIYNAYLRTFKKMGLQAIPVKADPGAIGGDLSHEFQIMAPNGESTIYYDSAFESLDLDNLSYDKINDLYAVADEKYNPNDLPIPQDRIRSSKGIEVGHIFYFGTKYSEPMKAMVAGSHGDNITVHMGSYGIGVSRLVGAIIEASHDDKGIIWPEPVAPFKVGLINLKVQDDQVTGITEKLYDQMTQAGIEVLYDDRQERAGVKFADMDLIGLPWQVIAGSATLEKGTVELKKRGIDSKEEIKLEDIVQRLLNL